MEASRWLLGLSCALLVACAHGDDDNGFDPVHDAGDAAASHEPPEAGSAAHAASDAASGAASDASSDAKGGPAADVAGDAPGDATGDAGDGATADATGDSAGSCAGLGCSYGCSNGGCNPSCDGQDANCASFPGTYCAWQGSWWCQAYAKRGDYCGTQYDPKCAPPLTCKNVDQNGNYSPQPTCET